MEKYELDKLGEREREVYNGLHALRLVQVRGGISKPVDDSLLEQLLLDQEKAGNIQEETEGRFLLKGAVYTLTPKAKFELENEVTRLKNVGEVLRNTSETERDQMFREYGYTQAEYTVKKSLLIDGVFDKEPAGYFTQERTARDHTEKKVSKKEFPGFRTCYENFPFNLEGVI